MPRLTLDERRFIAAKMTEGLGYAEIARRLGRPTSTVSREVARNIGGQGYQPEQAEHRTRERGRRPKSTKPAAPNDVTRTVSEYEAKMIEVLIEKGMPRMAARVLACLYVTDSESLTAAELVRRLKVSPASVSAAVRFLDNLGMIKRVHDGRRHRYLADDDAWFRSSVASGLTMERWARTAHEGAELFGDSLPGERLAKMALFLDHFTRDLMGVAEKWRHLLAP